MTEENTIPMTTEGMKLDQLIAMLQAAYSQGARTVQMACRTDDGDAIGCDVEWVSMAPVDECVYLAAISSQGAWDTIGFEAMESLDW